MNFVLFQFYHIILYSVHFKLCRFSKKEIKERSFWNLYGFSQFLIRYSCIGIGILELELEFEFIFELLKFYWNGELRIGVGKREEVKIKMREIIVLNSQVVPSLLYSLFAIRYSSKYEQSFICYLLSCKTPHISI